MNHVSRSYYHNNKTCIHEKMFNKTSYKTYVVYMFYTQIRNVQFSSKPTHDWIFNSLDVAAVHRLSNQGFTSCLSLSWNILFVEGHHHSLQEFVVI